MIDGDDKLSRRYRDLGAEEPPRALDEAILASARRAVAPRSTQRWAMPVSIAAVLVLAVGVTLRMQQEQPGIEMSAPNEYSVPAPSAEPSVAPPPAKPPADKALAAQAPPATVPEEARQRPMQDSRRDAQVGQEKPTAAKKLAKDAMLEKPSSPAPPMQAKTDESSAGKLTVDEVARAQPVPRTEPKAFADAAAPPPASTVAAPAPNAAARDNVAIPAAGAPARESASVAPAPAAAPLSTPAPALRAKREAQGIAASPAKETPIERELERIARLRREGRHAEADAALEKFRRENPSYRIPDAMWEQVKPR